jgi:hypothetical protein
LIVEIDDSIRAAVEGVGGANRGARSRIAVVTSEDPEVAAAMRKLAFFDRLDPSSKNPDRNLVFLLARHRTGVTPNTSILVDYESVSHGANLSLYLSLHQPG